MSFQIIDYFKKQKKNCFKQIVHYLNHCVETYKQKKLMCIFDIDETLLFTSKSENKVTHHPLGQKIYNYCISKKYKYCFDNSS